MTNRTRTLVSVLLKTPELLEALKQNPRALATGFGLPDQTYWLTGIGLGLIENYANQLSSSWFDSGLPIRETAKLRRKVSSSASGAAAASRSQGNSVPIVAAMGIASIAGMLTAAGVVATVAINKSKARNAGRKYLPRRS